jgi:hypothetical protein
MNELDDAPFNDGLRNAYGSLPISNTKGAQTTSFGSLIQAPERLLRYRSLNYIADNLVKMHSFDISEEFFSRTARAPHEINESIEPSQTTLKNI